MVATASCRSSEPIARHPHRGVDLRADRGTAESTLDTTFSPERVARLATACLESCPSFRGRGKWVQFSCQDRCLVLDGRLPSYYLKQLAQEAVRGVAGIDRIENRIVVSDLFSTRSCANE